jgi:diguanylate cyclase (GGDEF)-like protein
MIENILSSGFQFREDEYELKTKYVLLNGMLLILAIALLVVGSFRMMTNYHIQGLIDYGVIALAMLFILALRKSKKGNYKLLAYIIAYTASGIVIFSYYANNGNLNINAWFTALIIPIFFMLGYRVAIVMAILFMTGIALFSLNLGHTDTLNLLFGYVPLFLSIIFLHIYELRFQQFAKLLTDTNNNLEKKVREKTLERTQVLEEQKNELHHQAHHDYLTGLPNRVQFQKRVQEITSKSDHNHRSVAILFIDLDNFKNINDSFGHDIGDKVIDIAAERIQGCIRKDDFLARFGGDEFVVLIDYFDDKDDLESIASHIISCISDPIEIERRSMFVSCSIGISLYPDDTVSFQDFIKYADTAMYKAKERGRDNYQFYSTDMTEHAFEKILMETSMRFALEKEEFVVHYQPQVDAVTEKIIGVEALVRWDHETMGLVSPGTFIPLAEESGLIIALDQWVMKTGMAQIKAWYDKGYAPGRLSLNLSTKQLQQQDFLSTIECMLEETGCKAEWIELEVTESNIMHNILEAINTLNQLRDLGIHIAIDDFGTGYSSLSYLKRLPVNKLKIDRSFIIDIPGNKEDAAITNAIIAIADSLNLTVIAEGVESKKQKKYLLENGCRYIQGYLYYRPMAADKMEAILQKSILTLPHNPD